VPIVIVVVVVERQKRETAEVEGVDV